MERVVIDARELNTSSGRYVNKLIVYLQKVDKDNHYKLLIKPPDIDSISIVNPNFETVQTNVKEFTFKEQLELKQQIKGLKPDLVHFTFPQQPTLYKGKVITTFHDLTTLRFNNPTKNLAVFKLKQKVYAWVMKRAVKRSQIVITPSHFVKEDIVKTFNAPPGKIAVVYEAAEPIKESAEPVLELESKQLIMYVGRSTPHKNLARLIDAFNKLKTDYPDLILVLGGKIDANYEKLASYVNKKSIEGVLFTGFLTEGQLKWLYQNCQAYVFPSLSEGFGLPGLEAMIHGAPVISSNATCLPEIYGDAAYYFDPLDLDSMVIALDKVLSDDKLRRRIINAGKERVKRYSWEKMARQTLDLYKEVLKD